MADSVSKLREELLSLTGVDIQLDEDTFKSTYQILKEISEVWDDLSDVSRANVTELLAGKRQGNLLSALMSNFDLAEQVTNTSANRSQGSAQKELENYQKGIEYSLGQFKASFQELSTDFISSDLVKGVVDFGTGLINVLDLSIGKFGALKTAIAGVGLAAFIKDIGDVRTKLSIITEPFKDIQGTGGIGATLSESFSRLAQTIGVSTTALSSFLAVAAGLVFAVKVFDAIHQSADEALESFNEQNGKFESAKSEVDALNSELQETQSKIDALEAKGNLSLVEQQDLNNLREQNTQLETSIKLKEAELKLEARRTADSAHNLYNEWTTEDGLISNFGSNEFDAKKISDRVDTDEVVKTIVERIGNGAAAYFDGDAINSQFEFFNPEDNKDNINELVAAYQSYQKQLDALKEAGLGGSQYGTELEQRSLDTLQYIGNYADVMQGVKDAYTNLQNLGIGLTSTQKDELLGAQKFLTEYHKMVERDARDIQSSLEDIFKESKFKDVYKEMSDAYAEGNTDLMRSIAESNDELQSALMENDISTDDLMTYLYNEIDPDKLNIDAIKKQLSKAFLLDETGEQLSDYKSKFNEFIDGLSDKEIEILYRYVNANDINLSDLAPDDLEVTLSLAIEASGAVKIDEVAEKFNSATESSSKLLSVIDEVNAAINSQSTGEALSPDTFNSENLEEYRDALQAVNGTMQYNIDKVKELNEQKVDSQIKLNDEAKALEQQRWKENAKLIEEYDAQLEQLTSDSDEYQKTLASRNSLVTENNDIVDRCNYLDLYNQKLRESVGAYQAWLDAQNGGESGDMSSDVRAAMQNINDVFDTESSEYGKIGTHKYEAAVEFLIPEKVEKDQIQPYINSLGEYFNGEKSGVDKFVQEGLDKGLMEYDPDSKELSIVAGKTMQDFADAMMEDQGGWTMEAVQAMFGLLDDYTEGDFSFENLFGNPEKTPLVDVADSTKEAGEAADAAAKSYDNLQKSVSNFKNEQSESHDGLDSTPVGKQKASPSTISDLSTDSLRKEQLSLKSGATSATGEGEASTTSKTMEVVVTPVQDPNPLEIITQAQDDGKISVFANTPDGNGVLTVQVKPTDDGKINVSAVTPDGGEVLNVDVNPENDGVVNVSAVTPDGGNVLNIQLKPENDGKVNVSAVTPDGGEALNVNIDGKVGDITSAQSEMQATLESTPLKQPINAYYADETVETPEVEATEEEVDLTGKVTELDTSAVEGQSVDLPNETAALDADTSGVSEGVSEGEALINSFDGETATADLNANNNVDSAVASANASLNSIDGKTVTTTIRTVRTESTLAGAGVHGLNGTAHVRGTAYATGSWGAKRDETALTGEMGREILVDSKTGKWHTIGDNGAEFVRVKRGDIIFNHKQTEELLARGFVNGRGSALMRGTAYASGVTNQKVSGNVGWTFGSNSSSTKDTKANTAATQANTAATKKDTKEKTKNTTKAKKLGDLYDWVAVRLEYFANRTKKIADEITDYVSSSFKTSQLWKQIGANQQELGANQRGADLYKVQANNVAKQLKMSKKLVNKAQTGAWQFQKLSNKDKEKVQTYLKYYDKYVDAQEKVRALRTEQLELFEQWANMPAEKASKEIDKLSDSLTLLSNAYNIATSGASALAKYAETAARSSGTKNLDSAVIARSNSVGYKAANALLDKQLENTMSQMNTYQAEYNSTTANMNWARDNIANTRNAANAARNQVTSMAQTLLGKKAIKKALNKSQEAALASGGLVNTKGLSGNVLKQIKDYNALVSAATTASYSAEDAVQKYTIATQAQQAALQKLAESQEEYAQMIVENEKKKFENIKNFYDLEIEAQRQVADNAEKFRKYQEAYGNDMEEGFYQTQIDALNKQLFKMQNEEADLKAALKSAEENGIIEGSEEWVNLNNQILAITGNIHSLKTEILGVQDEMRKEVFYQALDKALKKADDLRGSLSTIRDIIADEMLFDDDGRITDFGITTLAMDVKEYESYLDSMGTLLQKRQKYIEAFGAGDNKNQTKYSRKEFDEDMSAIQKDIQDLLKNADNARKAIIDMVTKTSKAEVDALMEAIDARKELLKKQKDYYDYDKSLKDKTKDIQLLEQQERALQNSAAAEDKAMLARIRAQKQEAQEALDDTVRDHIYNLQVDGLDDLKTELQDNYDKYVKDLSRNLELITESVDGATQTVTGALNTVNDTVKTLLNSYGVTGLNNESIGLPKFASGSRRVGRSGYGLTNETRDEIVVGDRGVFVPLSASSAVVKPNLTDRLFGLADNYSSIMSSIGKHGAVATIQSNEGNVISPVINAPISIVGNQIDEQGVIRAINKQLPVISRTVQEDIRKDLRKSR